MDVRSNHRYALACQQRRFRAQPCSGAVSPIESLPSFPTVQLGVEIATGALVALPHLGFDSGTFPIRRRRVAADLEPRDGSPVITDALTELFLTEFVANTPVRCFDVLFQCRPTIQIRKLTPPTKLKIVNQKAQRVRRRQSDALL